MCPRRILAADDARCAIVMTGYISRQETELHQSQEFLAQTNLVKSCTNINVIEGVLLMWCIRVVFSPSNGWGVT